MSGDRRDQGDRGDQLVVIGNPENRRVAAFVAAARAQGLPDPQVFAHVDLVRRPEALLTLPDAPLHVRIDSTGEDAEVEGLLLERGLHAAHHDGRCEIAPRGTRPAFGRLQAPRQRHLGFLRYIADLQAIFAQRPQWTIWSPPATIRALFDKRETSERLRRAGVPVPERLPEVEHRRALCVQMAERGWDQVVVKLSCGSSASGLAVFNGRTLMTTMRWEGDGWANSLKVQRVSEPRAMDRVIDWILAEGAQIERFVPKARFDRAYFDLRVLCVAGAPAFVVMRQAHHPITNLHLGGWRGDLERLRAAIPPGAWDAAMESCRRAAALYPCHHVGIDLMFTPRLDDHRIIELNAFGDLLPGLTRDGLDVYGFEIAHRPAHSES